MTATNQHQLPLVTFLVSACIAIGFAAGVAVGIQPLFMGLGVVVILALTYFFASFSQAVLVLLIVRSSVDIFSQLQIPSVLAVGIDILTLMYVTKMLLQQQKVHTDSFWWFFVAWIMMQALWVVLLPLGGLGLDGAYLVDSLREWVRLFSWLMLYLLVMQLKDHVEPSVMLSQLLLGLIPPISLALLQMFLPSILPPLLSANAGGEIGALVSGTEIRIRGTFGHPNSFATYLLLFISLTWWKLGEAKNRLPWLLLLGVLSMFFVSTKALFSLMMLATFVLVLIAPRLNLLKIIGGILFFMLVIGLFASTPFGQERLSSLANTPLLNPDIDISRAILLAQGDNNSFNWRLSQWTYLLEQWQHYPLLGFGLGLSTYVSTNQLLPHNDYVRALVEGGIVGFTTYILFFFAQGARLWSIIKSPLTISSQRSLCLILFAFLLAVPVGMITENIWSHTTMFFYWWTILAIAGWQWKPHTTTP
ncbi:polymerase [Calothrix sp. HK-06]|nr:polymerase [Calothrix sp. HK-06]